MVGFVFCQKIRRVFLENEGLSPPHLVDECEFLSVGPRKYLISACEIGINYII